MKEELGAIVNEIVKLGYDVRGIPNFVHKLFT